MCRLVTYRTLQDLQRRHTACVYTGVWEAGEFVLRACLRVGEIMNAVSSHMDSGLIGWELWIAG